MHRGAPHVFFGGNQFQIGERTIAVIAVFPPQSRLMPIGQRALGLLPNQFVHEFPTIDRFRHGLAGFKHKIAEAGSRTTAIPAKAPQRHGIQGLLAFLELGLAHASGKVSGTARAFIRGHVTLGIAMPMAGKA